MVHAGCVFVAGSHPSRTWTSGSFESVRWNACAHRLTRPRFTLSSERVWGEWSSNPCELQDTNPCYQKSSPQRSIEPMTLHQAGQWAEHTTDWAILGPVGMGIEPHFLWSSHTSDLETGRLVATLPRVWCYRVSAGAGWPGVSILWLGELVHLICNSVAACTLVSLERECRSVYMCVCVCVCVCFVHNLLIIYSNMSCNLHFSSSPLQSHFHMRNSARTRYARKLMRWQKTSSRLE